MVTSTPTPSPSPAPVLVSLDWLGGTLAIPTPAGAPAVLSPSGSLQSAIEAALAPFDAEASVVVQDVAHGTYASVDESRSWYAASTFKAAILLTAYQQRDAGTLDFNKIMTLEPKYAENDLGTLEYLGVRPNDQITIGDAIKAMIIVSDTSMAALIQDQAGGNNVDATLRSIGATTMTVNSHDLPTTASDLAALMIAILEGRGVSEGSRREMLSLLGQEWFGSGIVAGIPPGTSYAHKSGSFVAATHDAGIVWAPNGPYVIVVMTDGSAGWEPIAAISAAVWDHFDGES